MTHYVPAFTYRNGQKERAACGRYVRAKELAPRETAPTCPDCLAFVEADAAEAERLTALYGDDVDAQAEALFGSPNPLARPVSARSDFDVLAGYSPRKGVR